MRASLLLFVLVACSTDTFTTTTGDASGGDDGARDSGDAGPACAANFCANAKGTTCNDFDQSSTPKGWSTDTSSGLTLGTTTTGSTSCPNALQVVVSTQEAPPAGEEPHGYAIAALGNPGDVTVTFDALLPNIPTTSALVDGLVFFTLRATADSTWSVRLERSGDTAWFLRVHEGVASSTPSVPAPSVLTGAWNHMVLTVHYANDSSGSASLTYQTGAGVQTVSVTGHATMPNSGQQVTSFAIGAAVLQFPVSQSYTFLYDSIAIDAN